MASRLPKGIPTGGGKPQDQTFESGIGVPQPQILSVSSVRLKHLCASTLER